MGQISDWLIGIEEDIERRGPRVAWRHHLRDMERWGAARGQVRTDVGRNLVGLLDEVAALQDIDMAAQSRAYLLDEAQHHAREYGWTFTPLRGKAPILPRWTTRETPSSSDLAEWVSEGYNLGLRTGQASGIYVVDIDGGTIPDECPETVTVQTGRGYHLYYRHVAGLGNTRGRLGDGIDTRGEGGQVVFVGSTHPETGRVYQWVPRHSPDDIQIAEMSEWMLERLGIPAALQKT